MQQESASPTRSRHETSRLGFEPDSASLTLAEQVDSGEYNKNKVYQGVDLIFMAPATGISPVANIPSLCA